MTVSIKSGSSKMTLWNVNAIEETEKELRFSYTDKPYTIIDKRYPTVIKITI